MAALLPNLSDLIPPKWDIFVSYAHEDKASAERIGDVLAKHGLKCWRDEDRLRLGDSFDDRISEAIKKSQVVLLLISKVTPTKAYVAHEVTTAQAFKRRIAPVFLEFIPFSELKAPFDMGAIRAHHRVLPPDAGEKELARIGNDLKSITRWRRVRAWASLLILAALILLTGWTVPQLVQHGQQLAAIEDLIRKEPVFAPFHNRKSVAATIKPMMQLSLFGRTNGATADLTLTEQSQLRAGDTYCIKLSPRTAGWLYVFQVDAAGKIQWLYPRNNTFRDSLGANPVEAGRLIRVPPGPYPGYELDDTTGIERVVTVLSATRWGELEAALEKRGSDVSVPSQPLSELAQRGLSALSKGTRGVAGLGREETSLNASNADLMSEFVASEDWLMVVKSFEHVK